MRYPSSLELRNSCIFARQKERKKELLTILICLMHLPIHPWIEIKNVNERAEIYCSWNIEYTLYKMYIYFVRTRYILKPFIIAQVLSVCFPFNSFTTYSGIGEARALLPQLYYRSSEQMSRPYFRLIFHCAMTLIEGYTYYIETF